MHVLHESNRMVVVVEGQLEADEIRASREFWQHVVRSGVGELVVDLRECTALDGSGVALLVALLRRLRTQGAQLRLWTRASRQPAELLGELGIGHVRVA